MKGLIATKYECTMDQCIQHANDVTRARRASRQQADDAAYATASGGRTIVGHQLLKSFHILALYKLNYYYYFFLFLKLLPVV